ncbi:MAG: lactate utilization protein [Hyphomicrobiales bacterium]|nr:LUD domain-containing protein [Hyphomicrobiales bacterium]PCJ93496.1 MAG: lactate utilization protein [Hyphomicrobiales bacterium]
MSNRSAILSKIRKNIANADDPKRLNAVNARLQSRPVGLIPARGRKPHDKQVELFCAQAEKVQSTVTRLSSIDKLPDALSDYLRSRNLPQKLIMGSDPRFDGAGLQKSKVLEIKKGPSDGSDMVGLGYAVAAVAETGTLMMQSGQDNPTSNNFLPETHIVVINASDVTGDYEAAWQSLRVKNAHAGMPRTVNMITGPSRSGDIEQKILLGAHGPRALQIFVIDDV